MGHEGASVGISTGKFMRDEKKGRARFALPAAAILGHNGAKAMIQDPVCRWEGNEVG